jgi:MinD-like ATPase involved in chromosome partitioning or flagellar assembly
MTTITFYSYKGGVGRSLAVANVAKYLQRFGQKVLAIDLDLEAPGLHYKFALEPDGGSRRVNKGVVDFIDTFCRTGKVPGSLSDFTVQVSEGESGPGRIWLMPAGNVPSGDYWRRLARINWHDMFYSEDAPGIPLFLEIKQRIEEEFKPDFLLIDSPTGITEVGGVATSVLPDMLVCLVMKNRENLEGAREVLRSIRNASRLPGQDAIAIVPVLTRIPEGPVDKEESVLKQVRDFLNENAPDLAMTLSIDEVFVLHSESDLELTEAIRVGGGKSAEQSPLLRDYLRLFSRLMPKEVVDPYAGPLVQDALMKGNADPA